MHKSCLAGFIIDCQSPDIDSAAQFWSQALGLEIRPDTNPEEALYRKLDSGKTGMHIEVQKVAHASRLHLDIEADDIEAEVRRLEKLGAKRVQQIQSWWVLEAPTGQRFCVVRPQRPNFAEHANSWK